MSVLRAPRHKREEEPGLVTIKPPSGCVKPRLEDLYSVAWPQPLEAWKGATGVPCS